MNEDSKAQSGGPARDPANEPDIIAIQLQLARQQADLSVLELSRLTGISKTVLHGYERGRTKPGAREIRLLSTALKISPNRLILGSDTFESQRPTFTSVYRKIRARPGLGAIFLQMLGPLATPLFDEDELAGLLVLIHGLIRSRAPEAANTMLFAAEELALWLDAHTLPDGSLTFDPANLEAAIEGIQQRIAEREVAAKRQESNQAV